MRAAFSEFVERCRLRRAVGHLPATAAGERCGVFLLPRPPMVKDLRAIVSDGSEWDAAGLPPPAWEHVSVSHPDRCPTWEEMAWVKSLFFEDLECVVEFHPPRSQYVNCHKFTLHLWRPIGVEVPLPPVACV